jgi:transcriptional regulator with PAS, ATPase and Fis domain
VSEPVRAAMVGDSAALARVIRSATLASRGTASVLIEGETGTGKELVAALIHESSGRTGRLVAVNMAAIPDAIFESALFGHKRGAFTGAYRDEPGYVRLAHRGTLFLDEISSLGLDGQAKLLRTLESGRVMSIGATSDVPVDFRVVAASNAELELLVRAGRFRADLYYRLCEWRITVPPLRERVDDIDRLVRHFLAEWNAGSTGTHISTDGIAVLKTSTWPGNIRQLRQTVRRAAILAEGKVISAAIAHDAISNGARSDSAISVSGQRSTEMLTLVAILNEVDWDISNAALRLDVTKKTVYARLQRYNVAIPKRHGQRSTASEDRGGTSINR